MLDKLLHQLVEEFTLKPVQEKGKAKELSLNEDLSLYIQPLDVGFFMSTSLGACPEVKKEELFTLLMRANFLGQGTNGATISLDSQEKFLTLSHAVPYDLNYKAFKHTLEDFTNFATYWKETLTTQKQG